MNEQIMLNAYTKNHILNMSYCDGTKCVGNTNYLASN